MRLVTFMSANIEKPKEHYSFATLCEKLSRGRPGQPKICPGTADPKTRKFNCKNVIFELGFGFRTPPPIPDPKIAKT